MSNAHYFYAVKAEAKEDPTVPEGVKKFIDDFFMPEKIFGINCFVATATDHIDLMGPGNRTPFHDEYLDGLSETYDSPLDWLEGHPELYFEYTSKC